MAAETLDNIYQMMERECPRRLPGQAHEAMYRHLMWNGRTYCVDSAIASSELLEVGMVESVAQKLLRDFRRKVV